MKLWARSSNANGVPNAFPRRLGTRTERRLSCCQRDPQATCTSPLRIDGRSAAAAKVRRLRAKKPIIAPLNVAAGNVRRHRRQKKWRASDRYEKPRIATALLGARVRRQQKLSADSSIAPAVNRRHRGRSTRAAVSSIPSLLHTGLNNTADPYTA